MYTIYKFNGQIQSPNPTGLHHLRSSTTQRRDFTGTREMHYELTRLVYTSQYTIKQETEQIDSELQFKATNVHRIPLARYQVPHWLFTTQFYCEVGRISGTAAMNKQTAFKAFIWVQTNALNKVLLPGSVLFMLSIINFI
jgi:hypothetical protein